jgi:DNA polymerase (family 10)
MKNFQIARILKELAGFYEMEGVAFKPRAYENAAAALENLDQELHELYEKQGAQGFFKIPGIGKGIADHLEELLKTGHLKLYERFQKKYPVDFSELTAISGIGPKTVKALYQKLKIKNLKDLEKAAQAGRIRKLPGFGEKSEKLILEGLAFHKIHSGRFILGFVEPLVEKLKAELEASKLLERIVIGGSYRRRQETVHDIDILALAKKPEAAMDFFVKLPEAVQVLEHGSTRSEIVLENGMQVDLRIVPEKSWGAALQYFTGDKAHNIKLRKIAINKGYKLSEYGLFRIKNQESRIKSASEEDIYHALGMDWMPPEIRTDSGEIEAAFRQAQGKPGGLPDLIPYGSVKGDLQIQTDWTDGEASIEEMALAAAKLGREYIAITDHTKTLYMTGGLDEKKLMQQMKRIDKLNSGLRLPASDFRILKGAEVNIMKDGSLDIQDKVLSKLEIVGIAVHSYFKMSRQDMTRRICRALANPHADIFFHPTTRIIQRREPIDFDFGEVLKAARKYKVALEIDSLPDRLDLHDTLIRQAVEAGIKLAIDSDAHHPSHLDYIHLGEAQARRGWATKDDILNVQSVEKVLKYFK